MCPTYVYCCNTLSRQDGTTPLFIAAQEGFTDIARLLLAKGAKPSAMDKVATALINAYIHTYIQYSKGVVVGVSVLISFIIGFLTSVGLLHYLWRPHGATSISWT